MKIKSILARQILDSRGNPTVEADVYLENGVMGRAAVPSGASTGIHEAAELRDNDKTTYAGKGVLKAVENIKTEITKTLVGKDPTNQKAIDESLIALDGTDNKSRLGANAILAVSLATAKAVANTQNIPLFEHFYNLSSVIPSPFDRLRVNSVEESNSAELDSSTHLAKANSVGMTKQFILPIPQMNIINGGKHAAGSTDIQEFMILPIGAPTFSKALQMGAEVFHALGKVLTQKGYATTVGDEGGYAPHVKNGNKEALDLISLAVNNAGYILEKDIALGLDIAASELFKDNSYHLMTEDKTLTSDEMIFWIQELVTQYPIISIEDGLDQEDWNGWKTLTQTLGNSTQIVGDDIFVTNSVFLQKGISQKSANAILIKLNQIGTVTETITTVQLAKKNNWNSIISHRSGETEDTTISHLAVGLTTGQIKTGSLCRTERVAKYNELLRIEELLGDKAIYLGKKAFKK